MLAHPRDALEHQGESGNPKESDLGWLAFWKVSFVASCIATVAIDHVTTKYNEVFTLAKGVNNGSVTLEPLPVALLAWLLAALAVVLARDWTELREHFSPYVAMTAREIKKAYQKLKKK